MNLRVRNLAVAFLATAAVLNAADALGQVSTWINWNTASGNWSTATNWTPIGVPTLYTNTTQDGDFVFVENGGTCTINQPGATCFSALTVQSTVRASAERFR